MWCNSSVGKMLENEARGPGFESTCRCQLFLDSFSPFPNDGIGEKRRKMAKNGIKLNAFTFLEI